MLRNPDTRLSCREVRVAFGTRVGDLSDLAAHPHTLPDGRVLSSADRQSRWLNRRPNYSTQLRSRASHTEPLPASGSAHTWQFGRVGIRDEKSLRASARLDQAEQDQRQPNENAEGCEGGTTRSPHSSAARAKVYEGQYTAS